MIAWENIRFAAKSVERKRLVKGSARRTKCPARRTGDLPPRFVTYPKLICLAPVLRSGSAVAHQFRRPERVSPVTLQL